MFDTNNPPIAYTIKEFCAAYGIGMTKTYEQIKSGKLKARKVGKRTIILSADAAKWAASLPLIAAS